MYKKIVNKTGKTFVCGDLHGSISKLNDKLLTLSFDKEKDLLISVGDLIDRGDDSVACLRLINEPWFKCVKGNHEQMAIDALNNKSPESAAHWIMNGGDWYFNLDQEKTNEVNKLIAAADKLPLIIETIVNDKKVVICHANYNKDSYVFGSDVSAEAVVWDRSRYNDSDSGWTDVISGADLFVFGHTPVNKPTQYKNQLYIDTGAVFGNRVLTIIEL